MLTECPKCQTIFRVTPAILKMGHGQVRCGKCRTQFDAIQCMLEEEEPREEPAQQDEDAAPPEDESRDESGIETDTPASAEEITMEGGRIEISGTYRVVPDDEDDAAAERIVHEHVVIDREWPEEDADDARNTLRARDEEPFVDIDEIEIDPQALDDKPADDAFGALDEPQIKADKPLAQRFWKRRESASPPRWNPNATQDDIDAEINALAKPPPAAPENKKLWTTVVAASVVMLIAQVVHHYRDPLVRDPKWGGVISRVYHVLGLTLTPNWDLAGYQLQQWGVVSDSAARDVLRIRASVTNAAAFSQPYPHIKLALEDRFGAVVAMREFAPTEYLPSSASANRMMAPRQRANAEIAIVDPGSDAVGFFIDACLPNGDKIVCFRDLQAARK